MNFQLITFFFNVLVSKFISYSPSLHFSFLPSNPTHHAGPAPPFYDSIQHYSVLHVRLESKSHENLFVLVMCDFSFLGVTALNVDYASELDLSSLLA
jgi:hypothetical protein